MGVNDRCAVGQCNNARKYPEKFVIKPHILAFDTSLQLRFWKCTDPKLYPKWTFACNRKNFKFGKYNVVCSNHFEYGRPTDVSHVPTLYLKGYDDESSLAVKRKSPAKRSVPLKKSKILNSSPSKDVNDSTMKNEQMSKRIIDFEINSVDIDVDSTSTSASAEHDMCMLTVASSSTYSISEVIPANPISLLQQPKLVRLHWHFVKEKKRIVKLYTGCPSPNIFEFLVDHVRAKHQKIHYYKGSNSMNADCPKQYQLSPVKHLSQHKPEPSRILSLEDEILMTLMRIRLDCPVEDLAFRFGVSVSLATSIITTFIVFLSLELKPLIYWPTPDQTISYKHFHFNGTFDKCEGIGDCTEQWIEHSKNPDAQYQTYSSYKSHNTLKKLIFCTKSGSISYISEAYAGSCTDRFITEDTNIAAKFTPGFMVLFDKGFNVQDLFLSRQVKCVLPPFVRSKRQFTRSEVYQGKRIARARIHVERVMGRLKEFRLLNHVLPINMIDLCDHIWNVAGAIVNMQPALVK